MSSVECHLQLDLLSLRSLKNCPGPSVCVKKTRVEKRYQGVALANQSVQLAIHFTGLAPTGIDLAKYTSRKVKNSKLYGSECIESPTSS